MRAAPPASMGPDGEDVRTALAEFGLTTAFMFVVFSLVHRGVGTAAANATSAQVRLRVAVVSVLIGLVIVGFIRSRPGRFSGAHMNPAITLGLFAFGHLPARRVLPYLAAQAAGSIAAAALTRAVWGRAVADPGTRWAVVQPGTGWTAMSVTIVETVVMAVIVTILCWVTARRPDWPLPWIMGGLFGLQGAVLGTLTGGSANPARQLGPALFSGQTHLLAVYLIAPVVGAVFAGRTVRRLVRARLPETVPGKDLSPVLAVGSSGPLNCARRPDEGGTVGREAAPSTASPIRDPHSGLNRREGTAPRLARGADDRRGSLCTKRDEFHGPQILGPSDHPGSELCDQGSLQALQWHGRRGLHRIGPCGGDGRARRLPGVAGQPVTQAWDSSHQDDCERRRGHDDENDGHASQRPT